VASEAWAKSACACPTVILTPGNIRQIQNMRTTIQPSLLSNDHNGVPSAIAVVASASIDQQHTSTSVRFTHDLNNNNTTTVTRPLSPSRTVNGVPVKVDYHCFVYLSPLLPVD
jgi:hypothetical protein